jgi:mycoredoxin
MSEPILTVYSTAYCGDCFRVKTFLDRHAVSYQWVDIDETPGAQELVLSINRGYRSVPTLVFPDGTTMTEPSTRQLAEKLQIDVDPVRGR